MTTMLDKCAVAGDITQGIDRRGVWTAAVTVIGGTSGTAVKLVSSDTVNGEYTDYKTLISAADAETDQYKGFVVDLHGAKKFIKVTGAVMATAVFGDCDHDVKAIAITEGEVPSGADLENNKAATIDASTYTSPVEVTPSEGKDGMKKATVSLSNIPAGANMLYAWVGVDASSSRQFDVYLNINVSPNVASVGDIKKLQGSVNGMDLNITDVMYERDSYNRISDTEFTISYEDGGETLTDTYTRSVQTNDVEVWNAPPEVETTKQVTIDVSTYDPANKPVITPTAGKQSMAEVEVTLSNIPSSFFDTITLTLDNPIYSKTLTKGATVSMNNNYVNMSVGRGDVTGTVESIGKVFATVIYVDSTQVLTVTLNTSHPEASEGAPFKVWGE